MLSSLLRSLWAPSTLVPNVAIPDIRGLDFSGLKSGAIEYIAFDKDNTLTVPSENEIYSGFISKFNECKKIFPGRVVLVSNSTSLPPELDEKLGIHVFRPKHLKPDGGEELIKWIQERENYSEGEPVRLAFIGDRVFTDILYANNNNFLSILVTKTISLKNESKVITNLRRLEHTLLRKLHSWKVERKLPDYVKYKTKKDLEEAIISKEKA